MSNENTISDIIKQFNLSLNNMEAGLTMIEYAYMNDQPISKLAQITVQDACEEIQEAAKLLSNVLDD